jgi:hypothetical protein
MADTVVEVPDEDTVTIDVTDTPELADTPKKEVARSRSASVDQAADELTKATKDYEAERTARLAAEQSAESERRARFAAEQEKNQRDEELAALKERADSSELTVVTSKIESAKQQQEAAQKEFERAMEAGEFSKAGAAQVALAKATAQLDRLEEDKTRIESAPKRSTTEGRVEARGTTFEQYLSNFSPKSQAWLRLHPDCVHPSVGGDEVKNDKMMAGHHLAKSQNIKPESDDYFRIIEETLGIRSPVSAAAEVTSAGESKKTSKPPPSAPPSRDTNEATGGRQTRSVTLNANQREMALMSYPHLKPQEALAEYARNYLALQAEGKIGRSTH